MESGWVLDNFKCVDVHIVEMENPLGGDNEYDSSSEGEGDILKRKHNAKFDVFNLIKLYFSCANM